VTVSRAAGVEPATDRADAGRATGLALFVDALGTLALNGSAMALNFVVVLLLSHLLGAGGYGAYASAFAWASILAVVAVLGLTSLVIRHTAAYHQQESWGLLRGLLSRANRAVLVASAATVSVAAIVGWALYAGRPELLRPFLVALALVPLTALTSIRQATMQGLGRVVLGRLPETVVVPGLLIAVVVVVHEAAPGHLTPPWAMAGQVGAAAAGFVLGAWWLRRALPVSVRGAQPAYDRAWPRQALPLLALNLVMAANAQVGTIMLGAWGSPADAGVFNVAYRVTIFVSFVLLAASYPLSPAVARLHVLGERARVEGTVVRAARLVLLVSLPVAAVLFALAGPVLSLFGHGFTGGATAVRIMVFGDLVNVLTGFGGLVLVMCGRESDLARSAALGAVLNVGLGAALIPSFGVDGAAVAMAVSLALSNLAMNWLAARNLGIHAAVVRLRTIRTG
jgi:O-antigen/teichoic acid export membrane protein